MAAFSPTTPPMAFSASLRPSASFSSPLWPFPSFAGSSTKLSLSSTSLLEKKKKKNSTIMMVTKLPNGKYIGENYLVKKVSAKEVKELLKSERTVPLIVDFYATWCGPCILMAQELEMLAVEYEKNALFVKVDTDDEYDFARDMQVRGLPSLYFISPDPNRDAIRTEGLVPPEMIKNIIDNEM